jgi:hypothetical protein
VLAALVTNGAAGLACGLAGSLALATTTGLNSVLKLLGAKSLYVFHGVSPFS